MGWRGRLEDVVLLICHSSSAIIAATAVAEVTAALADHLHAVSSVPVEPVDQLLQESCLSVLCSGLVHWWLFPCHRPQRMLFRSRGGHACSRW